MRHNHSTRWGRDGQISDVSAGFPASDNKNSLVDTELLPLFEL